MCLDVRRTYASIEVSLPRPALKHWKLFKRCLPSSTLTLRMTPWSRPLVDSEERVLAVSSSHEHRESWLEMAFINHKAGR